jgi:hypothetical protein
MKGYLIDAQTRTIHLVEVGSVKTAHHLISPTCTEIIEVLQFRNGDAVFSDACGFWKEFEGDRPASMGLISSDMLWKEIRPFWSRVLVLGCSYTSRNCRYDSSCDVRSTEEQILFWTRFFDSDDGYRWLTYNYGEEI